MCERPAHWVMATNEGAKFKGSKLVGKDKIVAGRRSAEAAEVVAGVGVMVTDQCM